MYYFKFVFVLLLFEPYCTFSHVISKQEVPNGTEVYEVRALPDSGIEIIDPKPREPSLFEIIYYHIIRKPFEEIKSNKDTSKGLDFDQSVRPFTNGQGYQFVEWKPEETHPVEKVEEKHPKKKDKVDSSNDDGKADDYDEKNKDSDEASSSVEKKKPGKDSSENTSVQKDDKASDYDEEVSNHERRKREINERSPPSAPGLPSLNLDELPSDVRKIYEASPDFARYFGGSDLKNEKYNIVPKTNVRNVHGNKLKKQYNKMPTIKAKSLPQNFLYTNQAHKLYPSARPIYVNKGKQYKDPDFKERAINMFNDLPNINKGKTYGMNLVGNQGTVWNGLEQTPVGSENAGVPNANSINSDENEIINHNNDDEGKHWIISPPAPKENVNELPPVNDNGLKIPPAPKIIEQRPNDNIDVDKNYLIDMPSNDEPKDLNDTPKNNYEEDKYSLVNKPNSDESVDLDFKNRAIDMFNNMPNVYASKEGRPKTYGMNLVGNQGTVWNNLGQNPVGNDNIGRLSDNAIKPHVNNDYDKYGPNNVVENPIDKDDNSIQPASKETNKRTSTDVNETQRPILFIDNQIPDKSEVHDTGNQNNSVDNYFEPYETASEPTEATTNPPLSQPEDNTITFTNNANNPEGIDKNSYKKGKTAENNAPSNDELKESFNNLLKNIHLTPKSITPTDIITPTPEIRSEKEKNEPAATESYKKITPKSKTPQIKIISPTTEIQSEINENNQPTTKPYSNNNNDKLRANPIKDKKINKPLYDKKELADSFANLNNQLNGLKSKSNQAHQFPGTYGMRLANDKGYSWNDLNPQQTFINFGKTPDPDNENKLPSNVKNDAVAEKNTPNRDQVSSNTATTGGDIHSHELITESSDATEATTISKNNELITESDTTTIQPILTTINNLETEQVIDTETTTIQTTPTTEINANTISSTQSDEGLEKESNVSTDKPKTNKEDKHPKPTKSPKDKNDETIKNKKPQNKETKLQNKNKPKAVPEKDVNENAIKSELDKLLKKKEFWDWLSGWSNSYMEILNQRVKDMVKEEVANQLKNISIPYATNNTSIKADNQTTSNNTGKDVPISKNKCNCTGNSKNSTLNKEDDKNKTKENNGTTSEIPNKINNEGNQTKSNSTGKDNSDKQNPKKEENGVETPKTSTSNNEDNKNKTKQNNNTPKCNKTPSKISEKNNTVSGNSTTNNGTDKNAPNNNTTNKATPDSKKPPNSNNTSVDLTAGTIYGNTVGNDHITNVFIFFNGNNTNGQQESTDNKSNNDSVAKNDTVSDNSNKNATNNSNTNNANKSDTASKPDQKKDTENNGTNEPSTNPKDASGTNNTSVNIKAGTVYGNTVGNDDIKNIFIFYNGNDTKRKNELKDVKPSKHNSITSTTTENAELSSEKNTETTTKASETETQTTKNEEETDDTSQTTTQLSSTLTTASPTSTETTSISGEKDTVTNTPMTTTNANKTDKKDKDNNIEVTTKAPPKSTPPSNNQIETTTVKEKAVENPKEKNKLDTTTVSPNTKNTTNPNKESKTTTESSNNATTPSDATTTPCETESSTTEGSTTTTESGESTTVASTEDKPTTIKDDKSAEVTTVDSTESTTVNNECDDNSSSATTESATEATTGGDTTSESTTAASSTKASR